PSPSTALHAWVHAPAARLEPQVEGEVIDPRGQVVDLVRGQAEVAGQLGGGVLHGVAQADGPYRAALGHRPADHRHRVDVVEQQGPGTQLLHVADRVEQDGDRPQAAHDPADPERVGDRLAQAEALGYL